MTKIYLIMLAYSKAITFKVCGKYWTNINGSIFSGIINSPRRAISKYLVLDNYIVIVKTAVWFYLVIHSFQSLDCLVPMLRRYAMVWSRFSLSQYILIKYNKTVIIYINCARKKKRPAVDEINKLQLHKRLDLKEKFNCKQSYWAYIYHEGFGRD